MRDGADVVYQAVLVDPSGWRGIADFLERQPDGSYEVADTKLARSAKPYFLLQLAFYSEQVGRIQGRLPDRMHVVLGTNERASYRVRDFDAYYRRVRRRFLDWVADPPATYPYPVSHCPICVWLERCTKQWEEDDHLSLVAHMRRRWIDRLGEAGITTLEQLAAAPAELETELRPEIYARLRRQAQLQHGHRLTGEHVFDLLPLVEGRGLALLPRPSAGDVFFDIEGDPFYEPARGLEYLFGVVYRRGRRAGASRSFWALDRAQEREAFEQLVDFVHERLARYPDMHVYHYAHYEPTTLKRLMGEHGDARGRDRRAAPPRGASSTSTGSSSRRSASRTRATGSSRWRRSSCRRGRRTSGPATTRSSSSRSGSRAATTRLLEAIERYNEYDCLSTYRLREWLLERRADAGVERWKEPPAPREVKEEVAEAAAARERLKAALLEGAEDGRRALARGAAARLPPARGQARSGGTTSARLESTPEELVADSRVDRRAAADRRRARSRSRARSSTSSSSRRSSTSSAPATTSLDPETGRGERIVEIDEGTGRLWIKRGREPERGAAAAGAHPRRAVRHEGPAAALMRLAGGDRATAARQYRALRAILRRDLPRAPARRRQRCASAVERARTRATSSSRARLARARPGPARSSSSTCSRQGKRVGVAAPSHKAIHNLLARGRAAQTAAASFAD